jgi:hypothetical protein
MAGFKYDKFGGIQPRFPDALLPPIAATVAENCDFGYGELRNTKGSYLVQAIANAAASVYTDDGLQFFTWTDEVSAVRSPMAKDTFNRLYYTSPTGFRVTSRDQMQVNGGVPATSNRVGVPRPTVAPVITAGTPATGAKESEKETRAYVYTYVNTYNEEGPPSPPALVQTWPDLDCTVAAHLDALTADYATIKEIRFYRTPTGSNVADYFYDGSLSVIGQPADSDQVYSSTTDAGLLDGPLSSTEDFPPDPALVGLMQLPNGILCAWKGNELHFCEAYKPWAWPPRYVKPHQKNIVGGIAAGTGALIVTIDGAYFVSGITPDSMSETPITGAPAGIARHAIAEVGGAVAYASNDGIVVVEGGTATLAYSEQFFTRDKWRELYQSGLSSMRFAVWDGRLVVYSSTAAFTAFMIRLDEAKGSMTNLPSFAARCSFVSPVSDQFYFASGTNLYQFAGGTEQTAKWVSREILLPKPLNFGFAQAACVGIWTLKFYSNDQSGALVLRHTKTLTGNDRFRLPDGFKSDNWKVSIEGTGRFERLKVAETALGLKDL